MTQANYDENLILGYVEQTLCDDEMTTFEKQLVADPRLRNLVAQLVADREQLQAMPQVVAPPQLMQHIEEHLERKMLLAPPGILESHAEAAVWSRADPRQLSQMRMVRMIGYGSLAAMFMVLASVMYFSSSYQTLEDRAKNHVVALGPLNELTESMEAADLAALPQETKVANDSDASLEANGPAAVLALAETSPERELLGAMRVMSKKTAEKAAGGRQERPALADNERMVTADAIEKFTIDTTASMPVGRMADDQAHPRLALVENAKKKDLAVSRGLVVPIRKPQAVMAGSELSAQGTLASKSTPKTRPQSSSAPAKLAWGQSLAESSSGRKDLESKGLASNVQALAKVLPSRLRKSKQVLAKTEKQKPVVRGLAIGNTSEVLADKKTVPSKPILASKATQAPSHADMLCVINAQDPRHVQEQVLDWAKRHQVRVISPKKNSQEVVLSMAAQQLPILIRSLNRQPRQSVQWFNPSPRLTTQASRLKQELPLAPVIPLKQAEDRLTIRIQILQQKP